MAHSALNFSNAGHPVLKHIVVWQLKNRANRKSDGATVKHAFDAMRGQIPGLRTVECGIDIALDAQADDIVLYCEFDDRAALEVYQQHPSHLAAKTIVGPLVVGRHVVDYEV